MRRPTEQDLDRRLREYQRSVLVRSPDRPAGVKLAPARQRKTRAEKLAGQRKRQHEYTDRMDKRREPTNAELGRALLLALVRIDVNIDPSRPVAMLPLLDEFWQVVKESGFNLEKSARRILALRKRLRPS